MGKTAQKTTSIQTDYSVATTTTKITDNNAIGKLYNGPFGIEYTGARYVPIFADPIDWNSQTTYEPLVVVTYQGNSYISRCYVPTGIDITDSHYWAKAADWNAQVEAYRKAVEEYKADVDDKLPQIEEATNKGVQAVKDAAGQYVDIPQDIEDLQKDVEKLDKRTKTVAIYIGNSYTTGVGNAYVGIYHKTKDLFDEAYMYVEGGAGFLTYTAHEITFVDLLQRAIDDAQVKNDEVTHVFFIGAWGDSSALIQKGNSQWLNQTITALNKVDEMITNNFPNYREGGYFWAEAQRNMTVNRSVGNDDYRFNYLIGLNIGKLINNTKNLQYYGWIGWNILFAKDTFSDDTYHPNEKGYTLLSTYFKQCLEGNFEYQNFSMRNNNLFKTLFNGFSSVPNTTMINSPTGTILRTTDDFGISLQEDIQLPQFNTWTVLYTFTDDDTVYPYLDSNGYCYMGIVEIPLNVTKGDYTNTIKLITRFRSDNTKIYFEVKNMSQITEDAIKGKTSGLTQMMPTTLISEADYFQFR